MDITRFKGAFAAIAATMRKNRDRLVELDQQNGDGDLGITMSDGYSAVSRYLEGCEEKDLGRALMRCSAVFNETAPSTLGTITSFALMGMARSLKGREETDLAGLAAAMRAGLDHVMEKARSKPGEKTILDSLDPAIRALGERAGDGPEAALAAAAAAARAGSEATKAMRSVHGRAAYYGDKSLGIVDGGSVVGALIFESLDSYYRSAAKGN